MIAVHEINFIVNYWICGNQLWILVFVKGPVFDLLWVWSDESWVIIKENELLIATCLEFKVQFFGRYIKLMDRPVYTQEDEIVKRKGADLYMPNFMEVIRELNLVKHLNSMCPF